MFFFKRSPKKIIRDDQELLSLYQASGDVAFMGELYERYLHLIFGVCMKYLKNEEESKDMSMQLFEKLCQAAKTTEIRNFGSWLHVLAKNECLMLLRSRKYKQEKSTLEINEEGDVDLAYALHPLEDEPLEGKLQELESALEELPPEQSKCIRLFYLEQRSYKEIAALTGWELNKVKSHLQNGKRNLKLHMQNRDEPS